MRRYFAVPMLLLLLLTGCRATEAQIPVDLRTQMNAAGESQFILSLRADFGDHVRDFKLLCYGSAEKAEFTVLEPEAVKGISATVSGEGAEVKYEDTVLGVEEFSTRRLSPMAAPYLLLYALEQGYIASCGKDGEDTAVEYTLGFGQRTVTVNALFRGQYPVSAEITDGENTLISCEIQNFRVGKEITNDERTDENMGGSEP